jgi:LCP family protein required for cell wall assembly
MQPPVETGDLPTRGSREKAREGRRWVRVTLWTVGSLVVVLAGLTAGYAAYLNHSVDANVKRASLLPTVGASDAPAPTKPAAAQDSLNMLLLGSDSRGTDQGRSDVIILAHISDDRSRVDLIHFPRDLYVDIPGRGKDKINAAYAYGGAPLLVSTLQGLIDLPLDHVALVDFEGFKGMTDAVGGVDVTVAEASPGFPKGIVHMNGDQGLTFVRDRHSLSQGDISRGERQQAFIKAVMLKGLSKETLLNPVKLANFINAATSNLTVDNAFDLGQMRSLALSMRNLRGADIHFWSAPWTGVGTTSGGASIVSMSEPQMAVLAQALKKDAMSSYSDPVSPTKGFSR